MTRKNSTVEQDLVLDAASGKALTLPAVNLHDIDAVRRETAKVYRAMKAGQIATQDGTRLVYVLAQIAKMHESVEFERRLDRLEGAYGGR